MQKWAIFYLVFCFGLLCCCLYYNLCLAMFYYHKPKIRNNSFDYRFKTYPHATVYRGYKGQNVQWVEDVITTHQAICGDY